MIRSGIPLSSSRRRAGRGAVATALRAVAMTVVAWVVASWPAAAFRIELNDVAPDRIERQRAEAIGQIPFPGTPNIAQFDERLKEKGLALGAPMFIRVFKAESELEVWLQKGDRFELFATYPICHWSGTLGPKISEGDKQAPEGVYTVTWRQLHMVGRHPRSLNLGFPNLYDRQFRRTGSWILIHGGCGSVGCFAMTNPVIDEVFRLAQAAIKGGQEAIHVHAFPFRMTESNLRSYALHDWYEFWRNLKDVYDEFETSKRVPKVVVCEGRYWIEQQGEVASHPPLAVCGAALAAASLNNQKDGAPSLTGLSSLPRLHLQARPPNAQPAPSPLARPALLPHRHSASRLARPDNSPEMTDPAVRRSSRFASRTRKLVDTDALPAGSSARVDAVCQATLPSCRKWIARQQAMQSSRTRVVLAEAHGERASETASGARSAQRRMSRR